MNENIKLFTAEDGDKRVMFESDSWCIYLTLEEVAALYNWTERNKELFD